MDFLMAILMIVMGLFCFYMGVCIFSEMPALYGAELVMTGFMGVISIICGAMCFAILTEI